MASLKSALLARLPWANFILAYLIIKILRILWTGFYRKRANSINIKSCLTIEAGAPGWNSLEFKEMFQSASEYYGVEFIKKVVIDKSIPYLPQLEAALQNNAISHYLYDPRTGRQDFWGASFESLRVALLLARYRVVPIVYLTDLSVRVWRCQASAVTAVSGSVITFMMPKQIQTIFPHRRLSGPSLMPLSVKTLEYLEALRNNLLLANLIKNQVRFVGSLYEPRTTFLVEFNHCLSQTDHLVEVLGRDLGSARVTDEEYWTRLSSASIVLTTADQAVQSGTDFIWIPHLVYRYIEVLASGSLLMAQIVPGVTRHFVPNEHFVAYENLEDAVIKARYYLDNPDEAEKIRSAGHDRAAALIKTHSFWSQLESALGFESITI
jgi:hypothetical protein